jgi:hypothetical protein
MTEKTPSKIRTGQQNKSLHLYCSQVAEALNSAGISYKMLLDGMEIANTMESTKNLFRLIGGAKFNKYSTKEYTTKQLIEIFEDFNEIIARKGIHIAWPSEDERNFLEEYSSVQRN